ncbi:Annexin repeat [Phytophthora cactorum]|nr:Annexin repeat [Phytophthora cactorum]
MGTRCRRMPENELLCRKVLERLQFLHDSVAALDVKDPSKVKYMDVIVRFVKLMRRKPLLLRLASSETLVTTIRELQLKLSDCMKWKGQSPEMLELKKKTFTRVSIYLNQQGLRMFDWFIPIDDVEYEDEAIGDRGTFGDVSRGTWVHEGERTEVVIKRLFPETSSDSDDAFLRQLDLRSGSQVPARQENRSRGLKCNNILVGAKYTAKLADFGFSTVRTLSAGLSGNADRANAQSVRWKPKEVLEETGMDETRYKSDIYSLAMCMIEAKSHEVPFGMDDDPEAMDKIMRGERHPCPTAYWIIVRSGLSSANFATQTLTSDRRLTRPIPVSCAVPSVDFVEAKLIPKNMRFARLRGNPPAKSVLTDIRSRCKWLPELEKLCLRAVDRLEALHDEVAQCREDDPPRVKYIDTVVILLDRIIRRKPLLTRLARFHSVTLIIRGLHQDLDEVETGLGTSIEGNEWRDQWERDRTEQFSILEQLVQNTTDRQLVREIKISRLVISADDLMFEEGPGVAALFQDSSLESDQDTFEQFERWKNLSGCDHILTFHGGSHASKPQFFVCEYAPYGNLRGFLTDEKNETMMWPLFLQAAEGLKALHSHGIVHGALKCSNILVDANYTAKLADFGFASARMHAMELNSVAATAIGSAVRWKPKEILEYSDMTGPQFQADTYSLGMCMIEALTHQAPFSMVGDDTEAVEMILHGKGEGIDIMASIAGMTAIKSTEEAGTVPGEMVKTEVFCSWEADGSIVTTTVRTTTCTRTSASGELITEVTNTETEVTTETTETTETTVEEVAEETMEGTEGTITTTETTEVTEVSTIETITEEADAGSEDGMKSSAALVASDTAAMSSLYARYAHESNSMESMTLSVDIDAAAQEIHRVCTGATSNEAALASLLLSKTVEQRYLIWWRYRILYKQNLSDLVKSKSDYGVLLKMLASPLEHAEAEILRKATKGLALLKKTFQEKYSDDLGKILNGDLSGSLKKVIETAMRGEVVDFDASVHTSAQASADADRLYKAGEGRWGTDKKTFINILVLSPAQHVRNINRAYMVKHKSGLIGAIKAEFSGDTKRALLFLNAYGLSAWVVRYFHLLERIFIAYRRLYRQDLRIRIRSAVRGEYRQLLLSVFDAAGVELGVLTPRSGSAGPAMSGAASRGSVMPMDKVERNALARYLKTHPRGEAWRKMYEVAIALQDLHDQGIIHGNLKPSNLIVGRDGRGHLSELESCKRAEKLATCVVKPQKNEVRWQAPECLNGGNASFPSDVYSLGMCIIYAISGKPPWGSAKSDQLVKYAVCNQHGMPPRPQNSQLTSGTW